MNLDHFNRLSQSIAGASMHSRRSVLTALGTAILSTIVAVETDGARAKGEKRRHNKPRNDKGNNGGRQLSSERKRRPNPAECVAAGKRFRKGARCCRGAVRRGQYCVCISADTAITCAGQCGRVKDNCGLEIDCGNTCSGFETCGGSGTSNTCGCTSQDRQVTCTGRCEVAVDNCGVEVYCGPCECVSQDWATICAGKCGTVLDNCGREVNCGNTCSGVETCGGGGTSNTCGCTSQPKWVTCNGRCQFVTDNCGRQIDCGQCGPGCFIGGTKVRMADGSDKAIELVEPGDRVLGHGGKINRVRGVLRPMLGDRQLYALNGGTHFVTASHPFLTTDGWKAVDPDAARAEVPGLEIGQLTVGDVLVAVTSSEPAGRDARRNIADRATNVAEREIPLRSLEGRSADAATQLYNVDVDGDDTYVANDLVVHNKVF